MLDLPYLSLELLTLTIGQNKHLKTEEMKTYHIIKNGTPQEVTADELNRLTEAKEDIRCDVQWYLNHGYMTAEDYKKKHSKQ